MISAGVCTLFFPAILHVGSVCTPFSDYIQPPCRGCTYHCTCITGYYIPEHD